MQKKNYAQELRNEIMEALKGVTEINCPKIHSRIQTESGYHFIENEIISMVLSTGQAPAMCIPQIESEL